MKMVSNAAASYLRSLLSLGLALFSSRWILLSLGMTDFGLFAVVGSLIAIMSFVNTVMAASASRHLSFAVGAGDLEDINRWFNASLLVHLILPVVLIGIGGPVFEYVLKNMLVVPAERTGVSLIVFRLSLLSAFVSMASVPFVAMFAARQRIAEREFWLFLQSLLIFILAWQLGRVQSDRLLFYAAGMVLIQVFICVIQIVRARLLFPECRINLGAGVGAKRLRGIFGYAGWSSIEVAGFTFREQGAALVLNLFYGPILNSAHSIAKQVSIQANQLAAAIMTSLTPEIVAREGRGDRAAMLLLSNNACKYAAISAASLALPLILEMEYVLDLWLSAPPPHAAGFARLILASVLIGRLTVGYDAAIKANGRIGGYQMTVMLISVFSLPLGVLFLWIGYGPNSLFVSQVVGAAVCGLGIIRWHAYYFRESFQNWFRQVLVPCTTVGGLCMLASTVPYLLMPEGPIRLIVVMTIGILAALASTWIYVFTPAERQRVQDRFWGLWSFGLKSI